MEIGKKDLGKKFQRKTRSFLRLWRILFPYSFHLPHLVGWKFWLVIRDVGLDQFCGFRIMQVMVILNSVFIGIKGGWWNNDFIGIFKFYEKYLFSSYNARVSNFLSHCFREEGSLFVDLDFKYCASGINRCSTCTHALLNNHLCIIIIFPDILCLELII